MKTPVPTDHPPNHMTPDGFRKLSQELSELRKVERPQVVREVADAAAQGDRSENAEYIYGKKRLREIDRRVRWLIKRLEVSVVVDPAEQSGDKIFFGARVVVEEDDVERSLHIVGVDEIAPNEGKISYRSPIGAALLGKSVDDEVTVVTPAGPRTFTIVDVEYR
jgi:transcription elongation factor GreB